MIKNRLLSIVCAVSMVATMIASMTVSAATTKADVEAADVKVRYAYDKPAGGYKAGTTINVKMYVDGIPTLDLYNPGGKTGKWNGTGLSQYSVVVMPTVYEKCEIMDAKCGFSDGTQVNYLPVTDEYRIIMAQTAIASYWLDEDLAIADPYFASFEIKLSADLDGTIEIPVTTKIVFQSLVESKSDQTTKTITTPIVLGATKVDVNFEALDAAIAAFEAKTEADYTTDSWSAAKAAYDAAVAAKTATTQAEVDAATADLNDAISKLVKKPEDKADVATYAVDSKIAPSGSVTFGISGEVKVTGTASFNRITFNLKDGEKPGKYDWDIVDSEGNPVSISAPSTTFGLNIKGCPVGANITVDSIEASLVSAE